MATQDQRERLVRDLRELILATQEQHPDQQQAERSADSSLSDRSRRIIGALHALAQTLYAASQYNSEVDPTLARKAIGNVLIRVIDLVLELHPDQPSLPLSLSQLLLALKDLDRGAVSPLLTPEKTSARPPDRFNEVFLRAVAAAAMTVLVDGGVRRDDASQYVAHSMRKMGYRLRGNAPDAKQIARWRATLMGKKRSDAKDVKRYQDALIEMKDKEPYQAADILLSSLPSMHPPNFPKKPPS